MSVRSDGHISASDRLGEGKVGPEPGTPRTEREERQAAGLSL